MSNVTSIMIVGVGGQGTLLASKLLGNAFLESGFDVKVSEVHGMSQRGGSVVTYVRYGDKVYSPIIEEGGADYILAFEQLEAARYLRYLREDGKIIINTEKITPITVATGKSSYPLNLVDKIRNKGVHVEEIDAFSLAKQTGNIKTVNVVLVGILAKNMSLEYNKWIDIIENTVPKKFLEENIKAFELGYKY